MSELLVISVLAAVLVGLFAVAIGGKKADTRFYYTTTSIELAFNWTHCGEFSALREPGLRERFAGINNPLDTELPELADLVRRTDESYCGGNFSPWQNEDSTLFYMMSGVLFVAPNASAMGIYWSLSTLMAIGIAAFLLLLWRLSKDPYVTGIAALLCVGLYATLTVDQFLSTRVFMWPVLLLVVAILVRSHASTSYRVLVVGTVAAGAIAAIGINLRAAYVVHYLAIIGIVIAVDSFQRLRNREMANGLVTRRILGGILAFILGVFVAQSIIVGPISNLDVEFGMTHHPFAFPLVGAVSVPDNELSQREGIAWIDGAIYDLAERVNPSVDTYEEYESTLWSYYWGLWSDYPGEMFGIYARKVHVAGQYEMYFLRTRIIGLLSPASIINSGYFYVVFMIVAAVVYRLNYRDKNEAMTLLVFAITGAALVDFMQAAALYTAPSLYYPVLIFGLAFSTALIWSVVLDRLHVVERVRRRIGNRNAS